MTMKKLLLTTHWSPNEVCNVLELLTELQEVIKTNYHDEIDAFYKDIAEQEQQEAFDLKDDIIPF